MNAPKITLANGLTLINFSSPHDFTFVGGVVLPACEGDRSRALMLHSVEEETPDPSGLFTRLSLRFEMSKAVEEELDRLHVEADDKTVILCPLPVLQCAREQRERWPRVFGVRMANRVSKWAYPDRFCE